MSGIQMFLWIMAGIAFFLRSIGVVIIRPGIDIGWTGAFLVVCAVVAGW